DRRQPATLAKPEAADVRRAPGVEGVDRVARDGDADRLNTAGPDASDQGQAGAGEGERRDVVASGVDDEQPASVVADADGALRAEARACAGPAGRELTRRRERAVRSPIEDEHSISRRGAGLGVH